MYNLYKCELYNMYNTYNTCIIHVLYSPHFKNSIKHSSIIAMCPHSSEYSSHLFTVSNKTSYTRIIRIIQPTFPKFIKHSSIILACHSHALVMIYIYICYVQSCQTVMMQLLGQIVFTPTDVPLNQSRLS